MEFVPWTIDILLATSLTQASWIPTRNQQKRAERDLAVSANVETTVKVHLSNFATLEELAKEFIIDSRCLLDANPLLSTLHAGDHCIVPYKCCGTSCKGKFCSKSPQCHCHSTPSAPVQMSGPITTCVETITTSIHTTLSTSTSCSMSIVTLTSSSTASISPASSTAVISTASSSSVPPGSPSIHIYSSITFGSSSIPGSFLLTLRSSSIPGSSSITLGSSSTPPNLSSITSGSSSIPGSFSTTLDSSSTPSSPYSITPGSSSIPGSSLITSGSSSTPPRPSSITLGSSSTPGSSSITLTNGDGSILTFSTTVSLPPGSSIPISSLGPPGIITATDPAGETVISSPGEEFTISTAVSPPITITSGEGSMFTLSPAGPPSSNSTSSSTKPIGGIFPVTTSVMAPKATNGGTEIPCNLWFFHLCIHFGDISIGGWDFNMPTGVRPPGPGPSITFPPSLSISVSISGTLPPWPSLTIGPDSLPTYETKPTDRPDDGCKTDSAEVCLTSTSFGVNTATKTTTSSVLSTCATIFNCGVTEIASLTATTSSASSASSSEYSYSCDLGCTACVAKRGLTTATAAPYPNTKKAKNLFSYARNLTLVERDIPNAASADGIADFYSDVIAASDTTVVTEDSADEVGQTEISSSRFRYFGNSELNILVKSLRGCTSVVVVSRLGAYVSHFWEPYFTLNPIYNFQTGVVNYLNTGRGSDQIGGVTENGVTEPLTVLVQGGVFGDIATTKIFIMTPATYSLDLDPKLGILSAEERSSLADGDFQPLFDGSTSTPRGMLPDGLTPIKTELGRLMPGVPISQFTYRRQTNDRSLDSDGYGKAAVVYSNNQREDPDTFEPIGPPQQAIWQCWMQGKLMDSDRWDAVQGQTGSCPANQKRQAVSLCSSPTTSPGTPTSVPPSTSISSTSVPPSSSIPVSTPSTVKITPTASESLSPPLSNLPTLTTAQSTPVGQTCVSTATSTQCALGPNPSQTACVRNKYCAFFAPTAVTTNSIAVPTPTGQVYIDIYADSDCTNIIEQTILTSIGECYSPSDSKGNPITFACFALTYISTAASNSAGLTAYKCSGCFAQFADIDSKTYPNLTSIQYQDEKPFTLGSLSLDSAGT